MSQEYEACFVMSKSINYPRAGVAYAAQLEHEFMSNNKFTICNNCLALGFNKHLKRCNGCMMVDYCSKECQKAQWTKHKPFCNMTIGKGKKNAYLMAKEHDEVLRVLIDAYRLRVEIDHSREEDHGIYYPGKWEVGLVWVQGDVVDDFQKWLDMTEESGILPKWWRFENRMETLALAIDKGDKESIFKPLDQTDLISRYGGDTSIRSALLILAELVVGYEGKGPPKDGQWYIAFSEHLDLHPEERAKLIKGSVDAVRAAFEENGKEFSNYEDEKK